MSALMFKLPLGGRPKIANCGYSKHGFHGEESYELPYLWCLHLYFYEACVRVKGRPWQIVPGSVTLLPPGTRIVYRYGDKTYRHFFVHFQMKSLAPRVEVPFMQHLPEAQDEILDRLQNAQRVRTYSAWHAEILFWGLLCDLADADDRAGSAGRENSLLKAVEIFTEERIPGKIRISDVARHVGLSTSQVNRTLKAAAGTTVAQFVRQRRLERAYRLLMHSTMPIKLIASECGIDNLQQFNKLMRRSYGKSPRFLRDQMMSSRAATWRFRRE